MNEMMKKTMKLLMSLVILSVFCAGSVFAAGSGMEGHNMRKSERIGDLIHESVVDGYMLSYHFMDLRDKKTDDKDKTAMDASHSMAGKEMDKPHHLMVYIMDKNRTPVLKGKVGFMIKNAKGNGTAQKEMGMFMSQGFGTTADMKKKGIYTITTKIVLGDKKLMDKFDYEMK